LCFFFIVFFWGSFAVFASGLANLHNLSHLSIFTWLRPIIESHSRGIGIIEGVLSPFILYLLMKYLKDVIRFFMNFWGFHFKAARELAVLQVYWTYLIFNVLLVSSVGGAIFNVLAAVVERPAIVVEMLVSSLPQQSLFFINYLLVSGLSRVPMLLLRLDDLFDQYFALTLLSIRRRTPLERMEARKPPPFGYATNMGHETLVLTIILTYSVMAPLITVFGVIYFMLIILVHKYNITHVHVNPFSNGGALWYPTFHQVFVGILIFQLTMLSLLSTKEFGGGAALLTLPIATVILWIWMHYKWYSISYYGPIEGEKAREIDTATLKVPPYFKNAYRQPELDPSLLNSSENLLDDDEETGRTKKSQKKLLSQQDNLFDDIAIEEDNGAGIGIGSYRTVTIATTTTTTTTETAIGSHTAINATADDQQQQAQRLPQNREDDENDENDENDDEGDDDNTPHNHNVRGSSTEPMNTV
jgi:hypothetical protein